MEKRVSTSIVMTNTIVEEFWGYRTIKLKLNHNLQPKERMMIIGSIPEIGSWKSPVLMKQ